MPDFPKPIKFRHTAKVVSIKDVERDGKPDEEGNVSTYTIRNLILDPPTTEYGKKVSYIISKKKPPEWAEEGATYDFTLECKGSWGSGSGHGGGFNVYVTDSIQALTTHPGAPGHPGASTTLAEPAPLYRPAALTSGSAFDPMTTRHAVLKVLQETSKHDMGLTRLACALGLDQAAAKGLSIGAIGREIMERAEAYLNGGIQGLDKLLDRVEEPLPPVEDE